jgi:hypothetical protein
LVIYLKLLLARDHDLRTNDFYCDGDVMIHYAAICWERGRTLPHLKSYSDSRPALAG